MQHFSAVMRLVPMTPKMWLELVPITPTPLTTNRSVTQNGPLVRPHMADDENRPGPPEEEHVFRF